MIIPFESFLPVLTDAALADEGGDVVMAEPGTDFESHVGCGAEPGDYATAGADHGLEPGRRCATGGQEGREAPGQPRSKRGTGRSISQCCVWRGSRTSTRSGQRAALGRAVAPA